MAGIYIHVPFCRKACHYCNFHFSTSAKDTASMTTAICREAEIRKQYINDEVSTIYFGGGTPSLLPAQETAQILQTIKENFPIAPNAEITIETNPDDITPARLTYWKELGINRLSIGVQSFFEEDLQWMNRAHNAQQAIDCIQFANEAGFENITIDLIYGTPTLSDEKWKQNVETAFRLNIPHLSCYALTVEPKTALEKLIAMHKLENVDPEKQSRHFELLMEWTANAGYEHYEISNFAKPGFRSKHNSSYWQGRHYLGLGPSAHSFNGTSRQWNIANNALYLKNIDSGISPFEIEQLTPVQRLNEYIMTALRTTEGIDLQYIAGNWGNEKKEQLLQHINSSVKQELITVDYINVKLTAQGKLFADGIAAELFF